VVTQEQARIDALMSELSQAHLRIHGLEQANSEMRVELVVARNAAADADNLREEATNLKDDLAYLQKRLSDLYAQNDALRESNLTQQATINNLKSGGSLTYITPDDLRRIVQDLDDGLKIPAIKFTRDLTGWGLAESKAFVEALAEL